MAEIHVAVIAHHTRTEQAERLAGELDAYLFVDLLTLGSTWNHLRALNWAANKTGHLIVLEDDAQPCDGFLEHAAQFITEYPDRLISFYLGTDRRPHQRLIPGWLEEAEAAGRGWCEYPKLLHAVAYAIPCNAITLSYQATRLAADEMLTRAWGRKNPVLYTIPSLVNHADTDSVENPSRNIPRKAWSYRT